MALAFWTAGLEKALLLSQEPAHTDVQEKDWRERVHDCFSPISCALCSTSAVLSSVYCVQCGEVLHIQGTQVRACRQDLQQRLGASQQGGGCREFDAPQLKRSSGFSALTFTSLCFDHLYICLACHTGAANVFLAALFCIRHLFSMLDHYCYQYYCFCFFYYHHYLWDAFGEVGCMKVCDLFVYYSFGH